MKKKSGSLRMTVCITLAIFYIASLVLLIMRETQAGLLCLSVSTVCGMGVMFYLNAKNREKEADQQDAESEEK